MTSRKIPESAVENLVSDLEGKANVSNTVTTNTAQTISVGKVFTAEQVRKSKVIDITIQPENYTANNAFRFSDKNGQISGYIENAQIASGEITTGIHARNKDGYQSRVRVFVPLSGTTGAYAIAPTPPAFASGEEIVTAGWVRNACLLPGEIIIWSASNPPAGYLICDGAAISRTTYAALFNVIGTTWGAGDGNTTFNLPNFVDRIPQGTGSRGTVGAYLAERLPNIFGNMFLGGDGAFEPSGAFYKGNVQTIKQLYTNRSDLPAVLFNASRSSSTYQNNAPVQQAATVVKFCIRY